MYPLWNTARLQRRIPSHRLSLILPGGLCSVHRATACCSPPFHLWHIQHRLSVKCQWAHGSNSQSQMYNITASKKHKAIFTTVHCSLMTEVLLMHRCRRASGLHATLRYALCLIPPAAFRGVGSTQAAAVQTCSDAWRKALSSSFLPFFFLQPHSLCLLSLPASACKLPM